MHLLQVPGICVLVPGIRTIWCPPSFGCCSIHTLRCKLLSSVCAWGFIWGEESGWFSELVCCALGKRWRCSLSGSVLGPVGSVLDQRCLQRAVCLQLQSAGSVVSWKASACVFSWLLIVAHLLHLCLSQPTCHLLSDQFILLNLLCCTEHTCPRFVVAEDCL